MEKSRTIFFFLNVFYNSLDALIYVIDSADTRRIEETAVELQQLLDEERLGSAPLLIMANKQGNQKCLMKLFIFTFF
jgi:ADP-ribosylation factor-like protein 3